MPLEDPTLRESLSFARVPELPGVATLHARDCARQWSVHHETFTICPIFRVDGPGPGWMYRGRRETITPGVVMLMEPGEIHRNTEVTPPSEFRVVFVPAELARRHAEEWGRAARHAHWRLQQALDPEIHARLRRFHELLLRSSTRLELETAFADALGLLFERCGEAGGGGPRTSSEPAAIRRVRELIEDRLAEPLSLEELAARAGLSRFHFLRAFRKHLGVPPHEYQIVRRVSRGRALLEAGLPVAEVAVDLGFSDQSHFGRHFKKAVGVSPARYARQA